MLEVIDEHSVDFSLLAPGDPVLDVGARGFGFARECAKRGHFTFCMEPDPTVNFEPMSGMAFLRKALVGRSKVGSLKYAMHGNGTANCLTYTGSSYPDDADIVSVEAVDIVSLMQTLGVQQWGILKLDVEGAEYEILTELAGPVAKMISVEFHAHTGAAEKFGGGDAAADGVVRHLSKWYEPLRHEKDERYCAGKNHWDSLFALKY